MAKITYNSISNNNIDDFAFSNGYVVTVNNPAFNTTVAEDPVTNPRTIPNPESKLAFMERLGRQYFEGQMAYGKKLAKDATRKVEDATDVAASKLPVGSIV